MNKVVIVKDNKKILELLNKLAELAFDKKDFVKNYNILNDYPKAVNAVFARF